MRETCALCTLGNKPDRNGLHKESGREFRCMKLAPRDKYTEGELLERIKRSPLRAVLSNDILELD
jgi:hypothetical protein